MKTIFSFSVRSESDSLFVQRIKEDCRKTGTNFSHQVLKALKTHHQPKTKNSNLKTTKN